MSQSVPVKTGQPTRPNTLKHAQTGSNRLKLARTGSNRLELAQSDWGHADGNAGGVLTSFAYVSRAERVEKCRPFLGAPSGPTV